MSDGIIYGVGVGPGDPELMTLKAHRLISTADVIAYPMADFTETDPTRANASFAREIAASAISSSAIEVPIVVPMRDERHPAQSVYDNAAGVLCEHANAGRCVTVLCEGDPFFYGSFMYLFARLSGQVRVEVVPGVSSVMACAARSARPFVARNEPVSIIPATAETDILHEALERGGAIAIMKVGRRLSALRELIADAGLGSRAVYVAHASLPNETVCPLSDAPGTAPYFSMILISGEDTYATP